MRSALATCILLSMTLSIAEAAVFNWNFNSTSGYSYNSSQIEFADGVARLRRTNIVHNDDSPNEFGGGIKDNVIWDTTLNKLKLFPGNAVGSITSHIIDSFEPNHIWDRLNWIPERVYNKPIVNNRGTDSGYETNYGGNQHTVGLYHFDESNGSTTFSNSAANNYHGSCSTNCPNNAPGFYGNALKLDGTQNVTITDAGASSTLDDMADYRGVQFLYNPPTEALQYKRTITLSSPSKAGNPPYRFELTPATFDYSKVRADGGDIRIWEPVSQQWLHYWIETWNPTGTSSLWVRLLDEGTTSFEMHYGNTAMQTTSSARDVFPHYDDFEREGVDRTQWRMNEGGNAGPATGRSFFVNNGKLMSEMITSPDEDTRGLYTNTDNNSLTPLNEAEFKATITLKEVGDASQVRPKYIVEMGNSDAVQRKVRFEWYSNGNSSGYDYRIGFGERVDYYAGEVFNYTKTVTNENRHLPVGIPYELTIQRTYTSATTAKVVVHAKPVADGTGPEWTDEMTGTITNSSTDPFVIRFGHGFLGEVWTEEMRAGAFDIDTPVLSVGHEESSNKRIAYNEGFLFERPVLFSTPTSENNMVIPLEIAGDAFYSRTHPNGNDIRFVDQNGTNIPYFIEGLGSTSFIWVKVPQAGTSEITMLYGNPFLPAASDSGIFDFFDDFSYTNTSGTPTLNPDKWEVINYAGPADQSIIKFRREAVHNFGTTGQRFTLKSKDALTGAKSLRIRMQKGGIGTGSSFCYGYGQNTPGSSLTSKGFTTTASVSIQNIQTTTDGEVCPEKIRNTSLSAGFNTTLQYGTDPVYYYIEDLHMSPVSGTRNFTRSMYYDNIQYPTDELASAEMGPTEGNIFLNFQGNNRSRVSYVFAYPSYETTPSITLGTERMSGIGKAASFWVGMVRGIMFSGVTNNTGSMPRIHGGYVDEGWNTISQIPILSPSYGSQGDKIYINGKLVSTTGSSVGAVNDEPFLIGGNTRFTPKLAGLVDELYLHKWIAGDWNYFARHMGDIRFQLRSCDTADCSDGGDFIGPDGTNNSSWSDNQNPLTTPPVNTVSSVAPKRYLQYKVLFEEKRPGVTPALSSMTIGQGVAFTTKPTVTFNTNVPYYTLEGAQLVLGGKNIGNVRFQLGATYTTSPTGQRWHYWNGTSWVQGNATANIAETNTIEELNSAIRYFPAQRSAGTVSPRYLYVRAFLDSQIGEPVEIDNFAVTYYNTDTAPSLPADLYANDTLEGAQSGDASPALLDGLSAVVSARYIDPDIADVAYKYILQVARDSGFSDMLYNSETVSSGGITMPPLHNGERSMNLPVPDGLMEYNTTYHWRVAFVDGSGKQSPFASATFSAPDTTSPNVLIAPADAATDIARNTAITATITDTQLGVDPSTIVLSISGTPAYTSSTCQTGFTCTVTPVTAGYEISVTPNSAFTYEQTVSITASASDGVNSGQSSSTFTTIPNGAPEAPEQLYANTEITGSSAGATNPERLDINGIGNNIAVSAIFKDNDADDGATKYRLQLATNNSFSPDSIIYTTDTITPTGAPLASILLHEERSHDLLIPSTGLSLETTYFWRIQFQDSYGNWSAFSPSGAQSARFSLADTVAPTIQNFSPADTSTNIAKHPTISFVVEDSGSGIDLSSLNVTIDTIEGIENGVCSSGFFCSFTSLDPSEPQLGYTVTLTKDTPFPSSTNISVSIEVTDNAGVANSSSAGSTFTTAHSAPDAPTDLLAGTLSSAPSANPNTLDEKRVLLSAIYTDEDSGDEATEYIIEISTDSDFTTVIETISGTFSTPVANGDRSPNIAVSENLIDIGTEYFWRVQFIDSQGLVGPFSPSGNDAARFTVVDSIAPVVREAGTVQLNETLHNTLTGVTVSFEDDQPIQQSLLDVEIDGIPVIQGGVCHLAYTCTIVITGSTVDVSILPTTGFTPGIHSLKAILSDGRQDVSTTRTFQIPDPTPAYVPTGSIPTPSFPIPAPKPTPVTPTPTPVEPNKEQKPVSLVEIIKNTLTGNTHQNTTVGEILAPILQGSSNNNSSLISTLLGVGGKKEQIATESPSIRPSAESITKDVELLLPESNPPRHVEVSIENSLCYDIKTRHNYTIGSDVTGPIIADIEVLRSIGVDFSNGGKNLALKQTVTRSELLRYLLQANCGIFDRDISGVERFPDVSESHPDFMYVMLARKYGYVSGYLHDGHFRPDRAIDRAEALKIILEVFTKGRINKSYSQPMYFLDIGNTDWFRGYIVAATLSEVVDIRNSTFRPYDQLTLEEIILLLSRSLKIRSE